MIAKFMRGIQNKMWVIDYFKSGINELFLEQVFWGSLSNKIYYIGRNNLLQILKLFTGGETVLKRFKDCDK